MGAKFKLKNISVGTDIETISRFKGLTKKKNLRFLQKIFTKTELDYCYSKKQPAQYLAARFAGKEAVIKAALSLGIPSLAPNRIEIYRGKRGDPRVRLLDKSSLGYDFKVSLSHSGGKAIAFVVALKKGK